MTDEAKNLADILLEGAKLALLVAGAVWAYFRFLRERTHAPRIDFTLDCRFHGVQCGYHVTEFLLIIKNQGLVKQEFHEITLRARGIERGTAPALWDGREPRLAFPLKIFQEPDVIYRRKYGHVFVEPGVVQTITYVTRLPETVGFVQVRAEFHYTRSRTHSAERVFEVPSPGAV